MDDSEIVAVRAKFYMGWRLVFCFIFGVAIIAGGALIVAFMSSDELSIGIILIIAGAFFIFTGINYIYLYRTTPEVIAEFSDKTICFYPSKKRTVKVEPQNILSVVQKNYIRSRFNTQLSGNLIIFTTDTKIILPHVMDLAGTREKLEKLRTEALFRLSKEMEAERQSAK